MENDKYKNKYRIKSARASWHNYKCGEYFVTICTKNRIHYFGEIANGKMILSNLGKIADECWRAIPQHFPHTKTTTWIIMPNHIHGIIVINPISNDVVETQNFVVETQNFASLQQNFGPQSKNLASVIRGFKIGVTKFANENNIEFGWQPRFYDHIIRNEIEKTRIANYIKNNVIKWEIDCFNCPNRTNREAYCRKQGNSCNRKIQKAGYFR